jgi:hypothetical protein
MQSVANRKSLVTPMAGGVVLFLCALLFYYFAVLRIDYRKTALLNLDPYPDAVEYFAQAEAMLHGHRPSVQIGYEKLPSAFPPGYPAMMLLWLKALPESRSILAPFRTNQTIGFLLIVSVFVFYTYLAMPLAGGYAALLLATLPGFVTFCRSSMSDVAAWLWCVLAFMFAYLGLKEERRWQIYLSAVFLAFAINVRLQSFFFLPLLLSMALYPVKKTPARWCFHCVAVGIVFLLAASPMLILNTIEFHSPLRTGISFWYPPRVLFSPRYIGSSNIVAFWQEFTLQPRPFTSANLFGTGTSFVAAFVFLIFAGLVFVRINRLTACLLLAGASFFVSIVCYLFPDGRYYLPLLILGVSVSALAATWATRHLLVPKQRVIALGIMILFGASCLGYPSRTGYKTVKIDRFQAWDGLRFDLLRNRSVWFEAQKEFAKAFSSAPGVVLSDVDPAYLNALLPSGFVAAPIDEKQTRRWSPIWHYGKPQARALARRGLDQGTPVYALFVSANEMQEKAMRLPDVDGYDWHKIESRKPLAVLQLRRRVVATAVE